MVFLIPLLFCVRLGCCGRSGFLVCEYNGSRSGYVYGNLYDYIDIRCFKQRSARRQFCHVFQHVYVKVSAD